MKTRRNYLRDIDEKNFLPSLKDPFLNLLWKWIMPQIFKKITFYGNNSHICSVKQRDSLTKLTRWKNIREMTNDVKSPIISFISRKICIHFLQVYTCANFTWILSFNGWFHVKSNLTFENRSRYFSALHYAETLKMWS